MLKIAQGAEAIVYQDNNTIIKERFSKKYRLPQLDDSLRQFRTRREAKILQKLEDLNFPSPHLQEFSDKVEDKAVDLFLLERALESKHYQLYPEIFERVLQGYKAAYPDAAKILERFEQVKQRGRNKKKE